MRRDEWFLDDHVFAGFEGLLRQVKMRLGQGGDHDNIDGRIGKHLVAGAPALHTGEVLGDVVFRGRMTLNDAVEVESWYVLDERDVEDFSREAVAYYSRVVRFGSHF